MGNDIYLGLSFKAVCFDFRSINIVSSVIRTSSTTGFDVITIYSPTLDTASFHFYSSIIKQCCNILKFMFSKKATKN